MTDLFKAVVTYRGGQLYAFRAGRKYEFKRDKPVTIVNRAVALKCLGLPGFQVQVTEGSVEADPEPAPEKKLLRKKKTKKKG